MLERLERYFIGAISIVMILILAAMSIMVFGNVVLRFFDSSINTSAELSRYLFIWLIFFGAIVVLYENSHLGMDTVVRLMPRRARAVSISVSYLLMMAVCAVLFWGLAEQHQMNLGRKGMLTGISLEVVNAPAYICAASMFVILGIRLLRFWRGQLSHDEMLGDGADGGVE